VAGPIWIYFPIGPGGIIGLPGVQGPSGISKEDEIECTCDIKLIMCRGCQCGAAKKEKKKKSKN